MEIRKKYFQALTRDDSNKGRKENTKIGQNIEEKTEAIFTIKIRRITGINNITGKIIKYLG